MVYRGGDGRQGEGEVARVTRRCRRGVITPDRVHESSMETSRSADRMPTRCGMSGAPASTAAAAWGVLPRAAALSAHRVPFGARAGVTTPLSSSSARRSEADAGLGRVIRRLIIPGADAHMDGRDDSNASSASNAALHRTIYELLSAHRRPAETL